jgi:hypothetical protein
MTKFTAGNAWMGFVALIILGLLIAAPYLYQMF